MWSDLCRRAPYYASDWTDALHPSNLFTVATSVVRIFFINLMPALAYVLDMYERTEHSYGVNEVILASALAAIVFSLFGATPYVRGSNRPDGSHELYHIRHLS